jgi:hypothetical protein
MKIEKRRYQCDYSGEMFEKLYKQYEWAGDGKIWTGLWVGQKYLDVPQEQLRTPIIKDDPKPVANPRPFTPGQFV